MLHRRYHRYRRFRGSCRPLKVFTVMWLCTMIRSGDRLRRGSCAILLWFASLLSSSTCDCCERGVCPARCCDCPADTPWCCAGGGTARAASPCCYSGEESVHVACDTGSSDSSRNPCRCWLESREIVAGQDGRDSELVHQAAFVMVSLASSPAGLPTEPVALDRITETAWLSSLIPRHPTRVLYGVWRN